MALSNWDTLAFNTTGKSCNGDFKTPDGKTVVSIYKNWIYLRNPDMWTENCGFVKDTIMQINSGHLNFNGIELIAERYEPQEGVFIFVKYSDWCEKTKKMSYKYFAGLGCCGYDDDTDRLVQAMNIDLNKWEVGSVGSLWGNNKSYYTVCCMNKKSKKYKEFKLEVTTANKHLESQWVGVTKETYNEFLKWLEVNIGIICYEEDGKKWFNKVKKSDPLRYNQGDAFFAEVLNNDIPATKLGGQKTPIAMKMIGEK